MSDQSENGIVDIDDIPEHLRVRPNLYVRTESKIVEAPAEDREVAEKYVSWPNKGMLFGGKRLTILTRESRYRIDEEIRVIHIFEAVEPGSKLYVLGPKQVCGEYVDGRLVTPPPPEREDPWVPGFYDGTTIKSPGVDYNYEISSYRFLDSGIHTILWELGSLRSNLLEIEVG